MAGDVMLYHELVKINTIVISYGLKYKNEWRIKGQGVGCVISNPTGHTM